MSTDSRSRLLQLSDRERRQLVERLLQKRQQGSARVIEAQPRTSGRFPVSYAQQRIWFLHQLVPLTSAFSVGHGLWFRGALDRQALQDALADVVRRHEGLRTTFELVDGQPMQCIAPSLDVPIRVEDARSIDAAERLAHVTRAARQDLRRPWDLANGPLVRARLWQMDDEEHAFFLGLHHIVCDGWSLSVLLKEMIQSYRMRAAGQSPTLPELPVQYADYSVWQRRWLESDGLAPQLATWQRLLAGAPRLRLPSEGGPDSATAGIGKRVTIPADVTEKIKALAVAENVTPFMVLLAAYATLLSRYSGQQDVVVGSPVASRTHAELENVVGCFMNPLPFRVDLAGGPTFRELVRRAGAVALDVYANQEVPFDILVRTMDPKREAEYPPLYQAMLLFHNFPWEKPKADSSSLQVASWPFLATGAGHEDTELVSDQVFPITLDLVEAGGVITGFLEYTSQFAQVLENGPADFQALVAALVADPGQRITVGPPAATQSRTTTRETAADRVAVSDVFEAFDAQAVRTPDAVALVAGDEQVTYRELSLRVARLATHLQNGLVAPDAPVGVLLERSIDAITTLLAVLRAGAAYLPLDPALPAGRLAFMLQHVDVSVIATSRDLLGAGVLPPSVLEGRTVVLVDDVIGRGEPGETADAVPVSGEHLAYVLFTSGSSGRPKAVAIPRRALANYVGVASRTFGLGPRDRVLQFASLSFDTAAEEIFPALTSGATLVLRTESMLQSVPSFLAACAETGITVLDLPTAYWHELTAQIVRGSLRVPRSIRLVILGGEKALAPRVREWRAAVGGGVRLLNTYGPTESTIVATAWDLTSPDSGEDIPIGRPVANVQAHVLDREFRSVAAGSVDELWIGGVQLARGYLNDPALTAERFLPDPFSTSPGARMYRTGDLARVGVDGVLEFAGRADDQVKLRGFRIEPGEVEACILQHGDVLEAAVIVRRDRSGDPRLVGYVVPFEGRTLDEAAMRGFLRDRLPEYMVPSAFAFLDKLPRTVQRKVDRDALPAVRWTSPADESFQAPRTELETRIAGVWAELLERERVGLHDNFFDLGGHSLLVIRLHARLREVLGADLSVVDLFQFPTVSSQAERVGRPAIPQAAIGAAQDRAARQRQAFRRLGK